MEPNPMTDVESSGVVEDRAETDPAKEPHFFKSTRRPLLLVSAGAAGAVAITLAVVFGVMWGLTSSELQRVSQSLEAAEASSATATAQLAKTNQELSDTKLAFYNLERGAKYTACVNYYGAFTQGSGFSASVAVSVATSSCASESAWTFEVKPAP